MYLQLKNAILRTIQKHFRTEDTEKLKAIQILDRLALSLSSYLRTRVSRLNQANGIPFSMKLDAEEDSGVVALKRASRIAEEYGVADMTLNEINAEIAEARK